MALLPPQSQTFIIIPNFIPLLKPYFFSFPNSQSQRRPSLLRASAAGTLPNSAIQRIADKLRSLGFTDNDDADDASKRQTQSDTSTSPGQIFVPLPDQLPKYRVGHTFDTSWSTPENPVPAPGTGRAITRYNQLRSEVLEVEKRKRVEKRESVPSLAELKLSPEELRRLRSVGIKLKQKLKVGKAGVTEGIVNGIHERWRHTELVKIKCDDICKLNMKRTHDLLERKTGGLVVWRSGSNIILYRGADYKYPYFYKEDNGTNGTLREDDCIDGEHEIHSSVIGGVKSMETDVSYKTVKPPLIHGVGSPDRVRFQLPGELQLVEESDHLLDGLGPRFTDWWGYDPLPVDADLLPAVVPGYRKPFRLLPYGIKPQLTNDEMTTLKRLGRPLPCHFALGRNRKLQGLAASITKLWERCEIAKIAVKRGVQNTNSEAMAKELKWLTGGVLLSRDREYIVLYRGKDFLPGTVSMAIEQQRNRLHESKNRMDGSLSALNEQSNKQGSLDIDLKTESIVTEDNPVVSAIEADNRDHERKAVLEQQKLRSIEAAVTKTNTKLSLALAKKARAETLLAELEKEEFRQPSEIDKEGITEEERYMLRKVGLRMKPFLLLGRRGVFDGTVENMHLHWKYRELVKIICGERSIEEVHARARTLEAESGGILVAVERISKGYAIIVYRGKNYKRPASLRPNTLLNKREALKRSMEAQRRKSLKLHVLKLDRDVNELQHKMAREKETINNKLTNNLVLQTGKEDQLDERHSDDSQRSDADLQNCSAIAASHQENLEGIDSDGAKFTLINANDDMDDSSRGDLRAPSVDMLRGFSTEDDIKDGNKIIMSGSEPSSVSALEETDNSRNLDSEVADSVVTSSPDNYQGHFSPINNTRSLKNSSKSELSGVKNLGVKLEDCSGEIPIKAARLSNRERLLLRKQALAMKKRPVLAVGKSNIVSGVAKTIKSHFQKHPLAIVNIKGRAKGTSIQEVVLELERATGAVLVSQEPSKVILYRGWGAVDERGPNRNKGYRTRDSRNTPSGQEDGVQAFISPELISAIRLECGLKFSKGEKTVG